MKTILKAGTPLYINTHGTELKLDGDPLEQDFCTEVSSCELKRLAGTDNWFASGLVETPRGDRWFGYIEAGLPEPELGAVE